MINVKKLSLIALVLVVIGAVGCLLTFQQMKHSQTVSKTYSIDETFSSVKLDSENARIYIKPTDGEPKVVLSGKKSVKDKLTFNAKVDGKTLLINLKDDRLTFFHFDFLVNRLDLTVFLPKKQYESIKLNSNNGKIHVEHLNATTVASTTDNGEIELEKVASKQVTVKTANGRISLDHVDGKINGDTDNGKISVVTEDLDRPIELSCDNGSITIHTEKEPTNAQFNVHVGNGNVNILNKYSGNAIFGQGKNLIKLSTDNGSIDVTK